MPSDVLAATLVAPGRLELRHFPYPERLEAGAVLIEMLASGICGTDKHTFRGETQQYAGTDHASSTPFPIIQGHENVGVVAAIGDGGATAFDGSPLEVGDRVVPAPNRACGECEYCRGDYPYYFCRQLGELRQLAHLCRGAAPVRWVGASTSTCGRGTPVFKVPEGAARPNVAVLTELFAVTHSLDLAAKMPRPGGFRSGDTVAVVGIGPVGIVHVAKASLLGASRVIAIDPFGPGCHWPPSSAPPTPWSASGADDRRRGLRARGSRTDVASMWWSTPRVIPSSFGPSLSLLRDGGTLIEVGAFVDLGTVPINPATILGRNLTIVGVAGEDARAYDSTLAMLAEQPRARPVPPRRHAHVPARASRDGDADRARSRHGDEGRSSRRVRRSRS